MATPLSSSWNEALPTACFNNKNDEDDDDDDIFSCNTETATVRLSNVSESNQALLATVRGRLYHVYPVSRALVPFHHSLISLV